MATSSADEALDRRVEALHVADHERDPGVARRRDHRPPFGRREAHRLLDEDVEAGAGGRDRGLRRAIRAWR